MTSSHSPNLPTTPNIELSALEKQKKRMLRQDDYDGKKAGEYNVTKRDYANGL